VIWGLPFVVALGLYLIFFRFLVQARSLRMARHVLTIWRVIISGGSSGTGRSANSHPAEQNCHSPREESGNCGAPWTADT
jgi:hypothetical protein